ncbi:MAG TPA: hypothetical protein VFO39_13550 [Candidatus Sulfotelmatobacter sp.]|nr:hypothetical protein [Candidatus Sulfotelmatobacter sp.]
MRGFLLTIQNPNTRKRYTSLVRNLIAFFGNVKLGDITTSSIEELKKSDY